MKRLTTLKTGPAALDNRRVRELPKDVNRLYSSKDWMALVSTLRKQRGDVCAHCGAKGRVVGDHIVEVKDGGAQLDPANVQLLCWSCHTIKTNVERAKRMARRVTG